MTGSNTFPACIHIEQLVLNTTLCRFVFLPLLYELVTGELKDWEVAPVFTDLLAGTGIRFLQGQARTH